MIQMFKQFFTMITVLFTAGEKLAKTADNFATWAEEGSGAFADQARVERNKKLMILNADKDATQLKIANSKTEAKAK